jgi:hypothetical protein
MQTLETQLHQFLHLRHPYDHFDVRCTKLHSYPHRMIITRAAWIDGPSVPTIAADLRVFADSTAELIPPHVILRHHSRQFLAAATAEYCIERHLPSPEPVPASDGYWQPGGTLTILSYHPFQRLSDAILAYAHTRHIDTPAPKPISDIHIQGLVFTSLPNGWQITGDTYPHRQLLREHRARWNATTCTWFLPGRLPDALIALERWDSPRRYYAPIDYTGDPNDVSYHLRRPRPHATPPCP